MSAILIEYLLGLYFIVASLGYSENRITADFIKLVAGIILVVMAVVGFSLVK